MRAPYSPLLTDFYQLTMAYGYWRLGMHEQRANFHLSFRHHPFNSSYTVSCGLASVVDFLTQWRFQPDDLDYLTTLTSTHHTRLFPNDFLDFLSQLSFSCDVDAVPEGTVVFPYEPFIRVEGPLLQCQLIESPLLTIINFQTLIATKASRICRAAAGDPVIEFGLRRAQGPDGALSASRAAYIGGCHATSNTLAGKLFDIPVRGTHAHSWVTAFESEQHAFDAYASILPDNCILLVDTYNTLEGVKHAIQTGKRLREAGADLQGIRLDSGDMASLSIDARKLLDDAGFTNTIIFASNTLDEYVIDALKKRDAAISAWGVGTNLVTAYDQPALDGVYKLSALQKPDQTWQYKLKISEQSIKTSTPGRHQVRRFFSNHRYLADVIYDLDLGLPAKPGAIHVNTSHDVIDLSASDTSTDLLVPCLRAGKPVEKPLSLHALRAQAISQLAQFSLHDPAIDYPVGLELQLHELKMKLAHS